MNLMNLMNETNFEHCIKCTICTVYCPVSKVNPAYPGPKQAGPDGERLRLKDPLLYDDALKFCTNCKRCEVACPSDVKIGDIIQRARLKYNPAKPKLRDAILSHTDIMGTLSTPLAPIVNFATGLKPMRKVLDVALKIDHRRQLPRYSFGTFRQWYKKQAEKQAQFAEQVTYFHGCFVNYNQPDLGKDVIEVMNALGVGVQLLEKEKCCGVAMIANGFAKKAEKQAKINIASLTKSIINEKRTVIGTSSTCILTLKEEYHHILNLDTHALQNHIELVTRYIYRLLMKSDKKLPLKSTPLKIAYHTPCHMEKLGWANYSIELLQQIPDAEVTVLNSQCCGIAGTYGFKKENYDAAQEIGASLFDQIENGGFDIVATDCETCKWQIEMSTTKLCEHPITLIAKALK